MTRQTHSRSIGILLVIVFLCACSKSTAPYEIQRERMISQQIIWRGITHKGVLEALRRVPREEFVLPSYQHQAYADLELPIGLGQRLSRPYEDAMMLEAMELKATHRILEVGTGAGYVAALMAELAKEVYTIEILESLALEARERLARLGYKNIFVRAGDGFKGWPEKAPFDAIILTCSPDHVPEPLVEQLREGGRLLLPLGGEERFQELRLYTKQNGRLILQKQLAGATFVPMEGKIKEKVDSSSESEPVQAPQK